MRIHLSLSKAKGPLPYNYQQQLVGALHKWLGGNNPEHDHLSLYSFSWLQGSDTGGSKVLYFPRGAQWFISAHDAGFIKRLVMGIQESPEVAWGMRVHEIMLQENPHIMDGEAFFRVASPVFIKRRNGERIEFYYPPDPKADEYLTETLKHKLQKAGIHAEGVSVAFDKNAATPKIKKVTYKGVDNKAAFCPIIIKGSPEQLAFAWNVGVGNSTGIGFGALI